MDAKDSKHSAAIPVVLIGLGRIGERHLRVLDRAIRKGLYRLAAVVDPQVEVARGKLPPAYADVPVFADVPACLDGIGDDLFGDAAHLARAKRAFAEPVAALLSEDLPAPRGEAPLLSFVTPSGLHFEQAVRTLYADCHLLMEKPVAMTREEAEILLRLAEATPRVTAVGHIYRYYPVMGELRAALARGDFGTPYYAQIGVRWGHDADYYAPAWRGTRKMDGGALLNQSIHGFDLAQWLLGGDVPEEVCALTANFKHAIQAEDFGAGMVRFQNGRTLVLDGTTASLPTPHEASLYLAASEGEVRFALRGGKIQLSVLDAAGKEIRGRFIKEGLKNAWRLAGRDILRLIKSPHLGIYLDLAAAVRRQEKTRASLADGARAVLLTQLLVEKALDSHRDLT